MNKLISSLRLCVLVIVAGSVLFLSSCKESQDEADLPVQEWTVTKVNFYPQAITPFFNVYIFSSGVFIDNFSYFKDFDCNNYLYANEMLCVPDTIKTGSGYLFGNGFEVDAEPVTIVPEGTVAAFYTDWFYQAEQDMFGNYTVKAKIKIVTSSIIITIM